MAAAPSAGALRELTTALGVANTTAELLIRRGYETPEAASRFLNPRLADLCDPSGMHDRDSAAARIADAVMQRQRVCVFGDYDCDGITSTAILCEALRELGLEVFPLLASRFEGGYGLSAAGVERVKALSPGLLITCDCGSSDHDSLQALLDHGIETVVIDHHQVPDRPLPAVAFLNPHRPECGYPYKGLASCGLALSVVGGVRSLLDVPLDLRRWLDLVAIGTIADVAPLDGDNRALVRAGLARISEQRRPGLAKLCELAQVDLTNTLVAEDVAFRLAPRLNAPGRLQGPELALELLLETEPERLRVLGQQVEELQLRRRALQDEMSAAADRQLSEPEQQLAAGLVVAGEGWNPGIIGIVAGRLADRFARPVVVVALDGAVGRGSVRAPAGYPAFTILNSLADCLLRFGGHQAAAGLELSAERLTEFRTRFSAACSQYRAESKADAVVDGAVWLQKGDALEKVATELLSFEPCGAANPSPCLALEVQVLRARELRGGHLRVDVQTAAGERLGAFGPAMGALATELLPGPALLLGRLGWSNFGGQPHVELRLSGAYMLPVDSPSRPSEPA